MDSFKENLKKFEGKKIIIKNTNGGDIRGELKKIGDDYLVISKSGKEIMCNLINIASTEEDNTEEFKKKHINPGA